MLLQHSLVAISQYRASSKLPRPPSSNCRVQRVRIASSNEIELPRLTSSNCCISRVQIAASVEFKLLYPSSSNCRVRRVQIAASDVHFNHPSAHRTQRLELLRKICSLFGRWHRQYQICCIVNAFSSCGIKMPKSPW